MDQCLHVPGVGNVPAADDRLVRFDGDRLQGHVVPGRVAQFLGAVRIDHGVGADERARQFDGDLAQVFVDVGVDQRGNLAPRRGQRCVANFVTHDQVQHNRHIVHDLGPLGIGQLDDFARNLRRQIEVVDGEQVVNAHVFRQVGIPAHDLHVFQDLFGATDLPAPNATLGHIILLGHGEGRALPGLFGQDLAVVGDAFGRDHRVGGHAALMQLDAAAQRNLPREQRDHEQRDRADHDADQRPVEPG